MCAFTGGAAFLCLYAVLNVVMFPLFGGFLTYPLLALVGDIRMLRSSVTTYLRPGFVTGLVCLPIGYVALVWLSARRGRDRSYVASGVGRTVGPRDLFRRAASGSYLRAAIAGTLAMAWIVVGADAYGSRWTTRADRAIAENPEWVFVSSWWRALRSGDMVEMSRYFDPADLADFEPIGARPPLPAPRVSATAPTPLNVILIVLESVGARWTSLHSRVYHDTTPALVAESAHGLVFDNFYAHIGRSSNSLVAILLSTYPKLDFRDITDEYPHLPGTSLATVFGEHGYRTAFITPSDMSWAGWSTFLEGRGFGDIRDDHQLSCTAPLSSWGVEDRCMFDGILSYIAEEPTRPFFIMGWTQQTHHPYEPTPGVPLLDLVREPVADEYDLNRYLNVLRETDKHLGRMLDGIRGAGLDQRTLVVIVGDHGQAFGFPHEGSYMQGRTIYEEDGHVPLLLWYPKGYESGDCGRKRSAVTSIWRRPSPGSPACRRARTGRAGASSTATTSRALTSMWPRTASSSAYARIAGSTSTICGKRWRSSTTSTAIRTSSTTSPRPSPLLAPGSASGWRRGRKPIVGDISSGRPSESPLHVGLGERPLVGKLGDAFVGRPVTVGRLRFDADQHRLRAPLRRLQRRRELERMARARRGRRGRPWSPASRDSRRPALTLCSGEYLNR